AAPTLYSLSLHDALPIFTSVQSVPDRQISDLAQTLRSNISPLFPPPAGPSLWAVAPPWPPCALPQWLLSPRWWHRSRQRQYCANRRLPLPESRPGPSCRYGQRRRRSLG